MLENTDEILTITDYSIKNPDWFVAYLQTEINRRDIRGITAGRIPAISVAGEHPFVRLVQRALPEASFSKVDFSGILPAVSAIPGAENESEARTIGQGLRSVSKTTRENIETMASVSGNDRVQHGLVSDGQIERLRTAIEGRDYLLTETWSWFIEDTVFVSIWAETVQVIGILEALMRSIVYKMRMSIVAGLPDGNRLPGDIRIRLDRGLVNTDFGRVLHGAEYEINFKNYFRNMTFFAESLNSDRAADGSENPIDTTAGYVANGRDEEPIIWPQ